MCALSSHVLYHRPTRSRVPILAENARVVVAFLGMEQDYWDVDDILAESQVGGFVSDCSVSPVCLPLMCLALGTWKALASPMYVRKTY